jgi:hypothetical protein
MADTFNPKFGAIVALPFSVADAVTNQSNVDLASKATGGTLVTMPAAGSILGISVSASANVTAGTATFRAHKASTEFAETGYPAPQLNSTAGSSNGTYASIRPGAIKFAAGDKIGVSYTSTTDCAPTWLLRLMRCTC